VSVRRGDLALKTLGLIPARQESKRIPDKNLQLVNGRPLVERAIICAKAALTIDLIVVSSDDERVKVIADDHDVPFLMRPDEFAQDDTPMQDVVRHALDNYDGYDAVCILEPPATFRRSEHIDAAVEVLVTDPDAESVRTVTALRLPKFAHYVNRAGFMRPLRSTEYQVQGVSIPIYIDNGIANVIRVGAPMFGERVRPVVIAEAERGLDIDTVEQLAVARMMAPDLDRV
jgi:CMP-N,N'-diacetyllegionaminic acid synthase